MIVGESAIIKRLIRLAQRARNESFELNARDWNDAVEAYKQSRPLIVKGDYRGGWLHPWQFSVRWNEEIERWQVRINAGFVNGLDAEVRVPTDTAPEETLARIGETDKTSINARLTEEPYVPIPMSLLRPIGPDAAPTGTSGEGLNSSINYEPVPEFFQTLGVGDPPEQKLDPTRGIVTTFDFSNQESLRVRRLLRAVDVTLTKDRPAAVAQWTTGAGVNGTVAQFDVTYAAGPSAQERAYIGFTTKHEPSTLPLAQDRLAGNINDEPFDRLHLGTIFFMSPSGEPEGAEVTGEWQPFVKHSLFWNLNHATNRLPFLAPVEILTFGIPLAGGVGNALANSILSVSNDAFDRAREFFANRDLSGNFWTT